MRSDLSLDSNTWDLVITDDIGIVENAAMTSQDSKFSLQLIQGEVFDDNRIGMPCNGVVKCMRFNLSHINRDDRNLVIITAKQLTQHAWFENQHQYLTPRINPLRS
jgi:hypothetical protein